ncbi:MAG: NF038122 family metalloprotease, partial [Pseudanabaenales cyanobacterium]|nr:NF038122 family metalloprotease [Pseudanabaenales cyanobacterium]
MTQFNFIYDPNVSLEQRIGFQMAAAIWSTFLLDDVNINLRITATDSLNNGQAVGGAIPIFHEQHYGVYREYLNQDIASAEDHAATDSLQEGNTVDVLIDGEVIDGNSTIMLTSAQAKALGMNAPLVLDDDNDDEDDNDDADNDNDDNDANDESASYNNNNSYDNDDGDNDNDYDDDESNTWDRNLVDADAQDGYIIINNSYTWNYDFTRQSESPAGALDFLTMALHEIGHTLGFVSGLDGLLETFELHSGETQAAGFTALDMFRHTIDSQVINNPDGDVADLTLGANAYFSLDGETALANFSSGQNTEVGGDGYQASHWERLQQAVGIMDPTLGYQERTNISYLDLQAMDVLGWDINYAALEQGLNFQALHAQALHAVAADFSIGVEAVETAVANGQDWYTLGYGSWWQAFKDQMIEMGYGGWWQEFEAEMLEIGYGQWWQVLHQDLLEIGYGQWWQAFENQVLEMGYGQWWQQFETEMLEIGYGQWWQQFEPQMLEMGYGGWWQVFEQQMLAMGYGQWWQEFEANLIEMGYGSWWQAFESQVLEMGYGSWWQIFEDTVLEMGYGQWWQEFE